MKINTLRSTNICVWKFPVMPKRAKSPAGTVTVAKRTTRHNTVDESHEDKDSVKEELAPAKQEANAAPQASDAAPVKQGVDAAPVAAASAAKVAEESGLSNYELERRANIERNNAVLAQLDLLGASSSLRAMGQSKAKPSSRGVAAKAKRELAKAEMGPPRRSDRKQNIAPTHGGGIVAEAGDGTITLASGEVVTPGAGAAVRGQKEEEGRHAPGSLDFTSHATKDATLEEDYLRELASQAASKEKEASLTAQADEAAAARAAAAIEDSNLLDDVRGAAAPELARQAAGVEARRLCGLQLKEENVLKAAESAVVHMSFQPRADTLLLAAADKGGRVSLWRVDSHESSPTDGVFVFTPHRQYVSGLAWSGRQTGVLYSGSYDGSVRALHGERAEWSLLHSSQVCERTTALHDASPPYATRGRRTRNGRHASKQLPRELEPYAWHVLHPTIQRPLPFQDCV